MSRAGRCPTAVYSVMIIIMLLGVYQACQCVAWAYDGVVTYVAADIKAKQDGGREVRSCDWTTCTQYWRPER